MTLDEKLAFITRELEADLVRLRTQSTALVAAYQENFDATLAEHGKVRCQPCAGTGALERLDAGHMRKFGLRDWDGCKRCGGDGRGTRGKGYVDA